jgi:hypothetical protein
MPPLADFRIPDRLRRVLEPLARIILPEDDLDRLGLIEPVIDHCELSLRAGPAIVRAGLLAGLAAFEAGAIARFGRPFTRLSRDRQDRWFAAWWESEAPPMRQLAKGVKTLLALAYWEHPLVKQQMEYHPERWIAEVAARRLRDYARDIREHDALVTRPDPLVQIRKVPKVSDGEAA